MVAIAVTGADGFVGMHLCRALEARGQTVIRIVRCNPGPGRDRRVSGDLASEKNLPRLLTGSNVVIHLAARAHVLDENEVDPHAVYRRENVEVTRSLANAASLVGVNRFVFMSSIGVNGNRTQAVPFRETDAPAPIEPYAMSKWEAEQALRSMADESKLDIVIIRAPLIYGPGNPGNFLRLLKLVASGLPLPLGTVDNRRSLIFVGNLVDALIHCAFHPEAAGQTYLVKDGEDIAMPELIRRVAALMGRSPRLVPFPLSLLRWAVKMIGRSGELDRLTDSLIVDDSKIRTTLGWESPYSLEHGLKETVAWYTRERQRGGLTQ